ncbi:NAD(P)-dependent dehydrogenase, short-chain alcohol dehydrogenase family [Palleronia salina]|uniref:NAD(P)-dependent dehydrogenase, short-chain alcohol dehydrogenase family n=1 Tax=Palleronia salina TaxID=313368 RepID=A0A1M6H3C1_9RHOB|nr:SDR family oxidoreductase [Palleronia salina]SHJ16684.1 NAD(P)-dependent dehydrogenase, short-chain alcohol dehydrogenase family [Palleronia salina]
MDWGLKGARVIVTGGAAGIGLATARAFADAGAVVHVCDIDQAALDALPDGITGTRADMGDAVQIEAFVSGAIAAMGGLDTLVNNAGIAGPTAPVDEIDDADWAATLEICLTSQFRATRHAAAALRDSDNASIVNISSLAGRLGFGLRTPYAAAKWGVIGFTKSLAIEMGSDGVRANAILPGIVSGDRQVRVLTQKAERQGRSFAEVEADALRYTSTGAYVAPEDIAHQALYLASPLGRAVSGQAISVCGDTQMLT